MEQNVSHASLRDGSFTLARSLVYLGDISLRMNLWTAVNGCPSSDSAIFFIALSRRAIERRHFCFAISPAATFRCFSVLLSFSRRPLTPPPFPPTLALPLTLQLTLCSPLPRSLQSSLSNVSPLSPLCPFSLSPFSLPRFSIAFLSFSFSLIFLLNPITSHLYFPPPNFLSFPLPFLSFLPLSLLPLRPQVIRSREEVRRQ